MAADVLQKRIYISLSLSYKVFLIFSSAVTILTLSLTFVYFMVGLYVQAPLPEITALWSNVVLMLIHYLRLWPNINTALGQHLVLAGLHPNMMRCPFFVAFMTQSTKFKHNPAEKKCWAYGASASQTMAQLSTDVRSNTSRFLGNAQLYNKNFIIHSDSNILGL